LFVVRSKICLKFTLGISIYKILFLNFT
jgi:hypothetical protein